MKPPFAICLLATFSVVAQSGNATDRYYMDIETKSPSGRYQIIAKSPENESVTEHTAFQSNFTYVCLDTRTQEVIWSRKQPMGEPKTWGGDPKQTYIPTLEGSPVSINVSDSCFTVIFTGRHELVIIDPKGTQTGKVKVLEDCITKEENDKYVSYTTAGPSWTARSHWYFATADSKEYFIIRPWWGRHFIIELMTGSIQVETESLAKVAEKAEKEYVLRVLQPVLDDTVEKCDCCDCPGGTRDVVMAAYLAGVRRIEEAVPALRKIENSTHSESSTFGGWVDVPEGRIDPMSYSTYTTRQSVHLSLRRLGEKPGAFPCTIFSTEHEEFEKRKMYVRKPVSGTRDSNAKKVMEGMSPEDVINLIDCPDYIPNSDWQYDIDSGEPYTLLIFWTDERTVKSVKVVRPARWQDGTSRDREW